MGKIYSRTSYVLLALIAIITTIALVYLIQPRHEPETRIGRAMEELADGVEDASDELKPKKSVGEKVGDAVEDVGDSIKDATN